MKWRLNKLNSKKVRSIMKLYNVSENVAKILVNNQIYKQNELKDSLNPKIKLFHDPFLMKGMTKTVNKIFNIIKKQKKILIYGDNDADGIAAAALLYNEIKTLGGMVSAYIPNRKKEGRGLSKKGINEAINREINLMITCDCGMNSYDNIKYANQNKIDVIITDHHPLENNIPEAFSILNPNQFDCSYPFKHLSGSGVALKLIQALVKNKLIYDSINLAMIGTLSDMVPLVNENRLIVHLGLKNINKTNNLGLRKMLKIPISRNSIKLSDVISNILPKINSISRIGDSSKALKFLTSNNKEKINSLFFNLKNYNDLRLTREKQILNEVQIFIYKFINLKKDKIIICDSMKWEYGILSLIAAKIRNQFNRPVVLISFDDAMIGRGSARSVKGFNLLKAFNTFKSNLISYGGHDMASGFLIKKSNFKKFKKSLLNFANFKLKEKNFRVTWKIDLKINLSEIKPDLLNLINQLEPFGRGNNKPLFLTKRLKVIGNPVIFKEGNHIRFLVKQNKKIVNVIGYKLVNLYNILIRGAPIDMIFNIEINNKNGKDIVLLNAKDIRLSSFLKLN